MKSVFLRHGMILKFALHYIEIPNVERKTVSVIVQIIIMETNLIARKLPPIFDEGFAQKYLEPVPK